MTEKPSSKYFTTPSRGFSALCLCGYHPVGKGRGWYTPRYADTDRRIVYDRAAHLSQYTSALEPRCGLTLEWLGCKHREHTISNGAAGRTRARRRAETEIEVGVRHR